jgi:hypothetical protein
MRQAAWAVNLQSEIYDFIPSASAARPVILLVWSRQDPSNVTSKIAMDITLSMAKTIRGLPSFPPGSITAAFVR